MALDYKKTAESIVALVGGKENVKSVAHCMTRLRFDLKDAGKADQEKLKEVPGVLGVIYTGGILMVILGKNLLPVYEAVVKGSDLSEGEVVNENLDEPKNKEPLTIGKIGSNLIGYISSAVAPMLPGLIAGGMLKVVLLLVTLVWADFSANSTYKLLSGVADAAFYFMPIFVAYGAAKKLGGTPIYAMLCAAALLHGNYTGLVGAGEAFTFFGIGVRAVSYSSTMLPALLIAPVAYYAEKFFNKIVPGIFKSILVGLGTVIVTSFLGFTILGPLGGILGDGLAVIFEFLSGTVGPIATCILAGLLPWLIMCGMHVPMVPLMTQALANPGYDALMRPALILHNVAEGGACIGVALRTKNKEFRAEALSIAVGCIFAGVSEPALYGVNLRLKKPIYGVMAGGAAGGLTAGLLGARAYVMGYSTVMALPIFQDTIIAMCVAIAAALVVSAAVAFFLGFEDVPEKK